MGKLKDSVTNWSTDQEIKVHSTGDNDSVEDAIIAIMNIKTKDGKHIVFQKQLEALFEALKVQIALNEMYTKQDDFYGEPLVKGLKNE